MLKEDNYGNSGSKNLCLCSLSKQSYQNSPFEIICDQSEDLFLVF